MKFPSSYFKFRKLLKGRASTLVLTQLIAAGGGFIMNLLSTQTLEPDDRGIIAFYIQLSFVVQTVMMLGKDRAYLVAFPVGEKISVIRSFIRANGLALSMVLGLAAFGILIGIVSGIDGVLWLSMAMVFAGSGVFGFGIRTAYILGEPRTRSAFLVAAVCVQLSLVMSASIFLITAVSSVTAWIAIYAISGALNILFTVFLALRARSRTLVGREASSLLRSEGYRLTPIAFTTVFLQKADRLLLPLLSTAAELGRYAFVSSLMELSVWPITQWIDTKLHAWRRSGTSLNSGAVRRIFGKTLLFSVGMSAVIGFVAYFYITRILPEEYRQSIYLILPLGIGTTLKSLTKVGTWMLVAQRRHKAATSIQLSAFVSAIVFFLLLTPSYGAFGTAVSTALGGFLSLTLVVTLLFKYRRQDT